MGRLFGTDGIRGVANVDLTPSMALDLGRAVSVHLGGPGRSVVLGQDPRRSSDALVAATAAGLAGYGSRVVELGVVTTPGLAFATQGGTHAAGVMVSASHNPAQDNGLKVMAGGRKVDDETELALEALMADPGRATPPPADAMGTITRDDGSTTAAYRAHLAEIAGEALVGLRIAVDCANGSASGIVPDLLTELGARVEVLFASPDGVNINLGCGSTHPDELAATVRSGRFDVGLAFDGDADRLIAIDERGEIVDGDAIMGICALERAASGKLRNNLLVATVMSNGGLERALRAAGIRLLRTPVGDRHVLAAMEREDASLGGEQSGHIIFREHAGTGDGILTAIELMRAMRAAGDMPLSELAARIPRLPQVMLNSAVRRRDAWEADPVFSAAVAQAEARLESRGRILVRPSGTEPKIRIMVEGDREDEIHEIARELQQLAEARLN